MARCLLLAIVLSLLSTDWFMAAPSLDLAGSRFDRLQRLLLIGLLAAVWNLIGI
jgi:hypothetical protein